MALKWSMTPIGTQAFKGVLLFEYDAVTENDLHIITALWETGQIWWEMCPVKSITSAESVKYLLKCFEAPRVACGLVSLGAPPGGARKDIQGPSLPIYLLLQLIVISKCYVS